MARHPSQPLQPLIWLGVPLLLALVATLIFAAPLRVWGLALPEPVFPLVLAFAWAVIRPSLLGPWLLLLGGLFLDLFWGGPLGLWGLSLLIAYAVTLLGRSLMVGQDVRVLFGWYLVANVVAFSCCYFFLLLDAKTAPNLASTFWQLAASTALFPAAYRLIERFEDADIRFR